MVVTPTPFITTTLAPMMTPAIFSAIFAPDTTVLANFVATMSVAPRLLILGSIILPNLCFRLRGPCYQHH
jgi:hypothetical protein